MEEVEKVREERREASAHICGLWHSAHIDDLLPEDLSFPTQNIMNSCTMGELFNDLAKSLQTSA
ncbi:hypothetical protein MAR_014174 [Mya arenaria]|uniref:Uncharacterized protein n=1 Tax=Mya arenaria TaxID=6604 RepID=A0ABY7G2M3_MYAAR|nr:hypothetical protein MAR_014174 [Mya arenaria]